MSSATARLALYMLGRQYVWQLLYADDFAWAVQGQDWQINLVVTLLALELFGTPFTWHKFGGGFSMEWVGYFLDYKTFSIGISESRARWLVKWLRDTLASGGTRGADMEEVLGRLRFASNALVHIRPWLAPMYAWIASTPPLAYLPLPVLIKLIFRMLIEALSTGSATRAIRIAAESSGATFYADAMASKERIGIGGYDWRRGRPLSQSPWYAEEIQPEEAPWVFEGGQDQGFRRIATLELIASIACVRLFWQDAQHDGKAVVLSGVTDNKGNGHIVNKLFSTRYPMCAAVMQLTSDLNAKGAELDLQWQPREENEVADRLSNGRIEGFDPALRKRFFTKALTLMNTIITERKAMYAEVKKEKERRKELAKGEYLKERQRPTRKPEEKLRNRNPWG